MHGLQPTLPLIDPVVATEENVPSDTDAEWHLDEHTREVGRMGIAAARARLRSSSTTTRQNGPNRGGCSGNRTARSGSRRLTDRRLRSGHGVCGRAARG